MRAWFRTLVILSALALAGACSASSSGGKSDTGGLDGTSGGDTEVRGGDLDWGEAGKPDTPVDPSAFWECREDGDCAAGQVCDCHHKCAERGWLFCNGTLCREESECPTKWASCQACTTDANCGSGKYCDGCTGFCRELMTLCQPCTPPICDPMTGVCEEFGNQCADGGACVEFIDGHAYCGQSCLSDYGCPPQYKCRDIPGVESKQCLPETGICTNLTECESDVDCEYGEVCNPLLKVCAPGCLDDDSCGVDPTTSVKLICSGFHCQEPCDPSNNPCDPGFECDDDGRCKKPGFCVDWRDCVEPATYCDLNDNLCKPGCLQDIDCKTAKQVCEDMTCVNKACKAAWSCAFGQVCQKDTAAEDFGECYEPEGPYCDPCDGQDPDSCGTENLCVNFQDEDGNDKGAFCLVACNLSDPDNVCPQGWECAEIQDQDGNVEHQCARTCYKPAITEY